MNITISQIKILNAVACHGSFHAAARFLNKTHPSLVVALKKLEQEVGVELLDRSGYRTSLSKEGRVFLKQAKAVLDELAKTKEVMEGLRGGQEAELRIVIGDITPLSDSLADLKSFSKKYNYSRLNLLFENLHGPVERLLLGEADLIIHHLEVSDLRFEYEHYGKVSIIPVISPLLLGENNTGNIKYDNLREYPQCIIKDTASHTKAADYYILPRQAQLFVGDQMTKREVILQGMGWGHMPEFLVKEDLKCGRLVSLSGGEVKTRVVDLKIIRLREPANGKPRGPMAEGMWDFFTTKHMAGNKCF